MEIYSGTYNVSTVRPDLSGRQVTEIRTVPSDVHTVYQAGNLWIFGVMNRTVYSCGLDRRCRRNTDQFQFAINLGPAKVGPLLDLQVEVAENFFILQAMGRQATLEHGLRIAVRSKTGVDVALLPPPDLPPNLWVWEVVNEGKGSTSLKVSPSVAGCELTDFSGTVQWTRTDQPPVLEGLITGTVIYRNKDQSLREIPLEFPVTILLPVTTLNPEQQLHVTGRIVAWDRIDVLPTTTLALKLEYEWKHLALRKAIAAPEGLPEKVETMDGLTLVREEHLQIPRQILLCVLSEPTGITLEVLNHREDWRETGLLLTISYSADIFFVNSQGEEEMKQIRDEVTHLLTGGFPGSSPGGTGSSFHQTVVRLKPALTRSADGSEMELTVLVEINVRLYVKKTYQAFLGNDRGMPVWTEETVGKKNFTVMGNAELYLRAEPAQLEEVHPRLGKVSSISKPGWLGIKGEIEVAVIYTDGTGQIREDTFEVPFQEYFIWEALTRPETTRLRLNGSLEQNSYHLEGRMLRFHYLVGFQAEATLEKKIYLVNPASPERISCQQSPPVYKDDPADDTFPSWERKISLMGIFRPRSFTGMLEIAECRLMLETVKFNHFTDVFQITGQVTGAVDYWDQAGYLRSLPIVVRFCRLLKDPYPLKPQEVITAKLASHRCISHGDRWWGKKLLIELEIKLRATRG